MRTKDFLKHLLLGAVMLTTAKVVGQVSTGSNVAAFGTDFLGWNNNAGNNFPLQVRHDLNQPIDWYTNAIQRMRLQANATYTIGSFTLQAKNGALGLSPNGTLWANGPGPFSRLHLHDGTTSVLQTSYRPWMDNGITFTTGCTCTMAPPACCNRPTGPPSLCRVS